MTLIRAAAGVPAGPAPHQVRRPARPVSASAAVPASSPSSGPGRPAAATAASSPASPLDRLAELPVVLGVPPLVPVEAGGPPPPPPPADLRPTGGDGDGSGDGAEATPWSRFDIFSR